MAAVMELVVKHARRGCPMVAVVDLPGVLRVVPWAPDQWEAFKEMGEEERVAHALVAMVEQRRREGLPL
jgi:hypothetical protein